MRFASPWANKSQRSAYHHLCPALKSRHATHIEAKGCLQGKESAVTGDRACTMSVQPPFGRTRAPRMSPPETPKPASGQTSALRRHTAKAPPGVAGKRPGPLNGYTEDAHKRTHTPLAQATTSMPQPCRAFTSAQGIGAGSNPAIARARPAAGRSARAMTHEGS